VSIPLTAVPRDIDHDELIRFERFIADLTARFVDIEPAHVDETIVDCQRQVVEALDLDRSALFQVEGEDLVHTHSWTRPECAVAIPRTEVSTLFPWFLAQLRAGKAVVVSDIDSVPSLVDRESLVAVGTKSNVVLPLSASGEWLGAITFASVRMAREWPDALLDRLQLIGRVFSQALARRQACEGLQTALAEVSRLRDLLARDNTLLRQEVRALRASSHIASESEAVRRVLQRIDQVAPTNATVLLLGETGSGKEIFAQEIHDRSPRHKRPMVRINCGAIPTALLESELFGRERGAFTGAVARQSGRFELADGSTIFLDEIGELPLEAQVKLLRVLQDHVVERLGSAQPIKVDVRIIAATNRDLRRAVEEGRFRQDLFYRLNVITITLLPLRDRKEDIPLLVDRLLEQLSSELKRPAERVSPEAMAILLAHSWPGNVRELRNVLERAIVVSEGPVLEARHLGLVLQDGAGAPTPEHPASLEEVERQYIGSVLKQSGGNVTQAARILDIDRVTLYAKIRKYGLKRAEDGEFEPAAPAR
jgi:transcriptional regulator with GAF, ATPase, and Fis domain